MTPAFSICIPVWEQHGSGLSHLKDLIHSIEIQTFQDYEIVISDHSKNREIRDYLVNVYHKNQNLQIRHEFYDQNYGNGVANLNNALRMATGKNIKIMFQDDFMFSRRCLQYFNDALQPENNHWVVCGSNHTRDGVNFERFITPFWNDQILHGTNTISSPSVLAFKNTDVELFDERLTMLMDTEYYYRLKQKYDTPLVIEGCLITNRQHPNQISSKYSGDLNQEIEYVKQKHDSN